MGSITSKTPEPTVLYLIDCTENKKYWEKEIIKMSKNEVKLVTNGDILHPWVMICNAKIVHGHNIDVTGTISGLLPNTDQPGMVVMSVQSKDCEFEAYYRDKRIEYITWMGSNSTNGYQMKLSLRRFISKEWFKLGRNKYVIHLDVISLVEDVQNWKHKVTKILDKMKTVYIYKRDVESNGSIEYPWIAICGAKSKNISSSLPKLHDPKEKRPDHKEVPSITDRRSTGQREQKFAVDKHPKIDMVKKSLSTFLQTNIPESSNFRVSEDPTPESKHYQFLLDIGESIRCVVHHVEEMNSNAIRVCGNQNVGRQVHIIVGKDEINDTLVINTQARKGIQMFLDEIPPDEIDVILQIQDYSTTPYLESYLNAQRERVKKINFLQDEDTPTHPWIFVCDTFHEDKFLKLKETSKDQESMLLQVHGRQTIPIEADIKDTGKDDNKQISLLFWGNSKIDDSLYMNDCAKHELQRIMESIGNVADRRSTGQRKQKFAVDEHPKLEMVKQSLSTFLQRNIPESSRFRVSEDCTSESKHYQFLLNIGNDNSKTQDQGESIRCVVHHVEEMNSNAIRVCGNQNVGRQVHIIVGKDGINDTLVINNQARKDIQMFLDENLSDEIDVILQIQDDSTTPYLKSYLDAQMERVNANFRQVKNTPKHPWVFVCDTFNEDKFLKLKETSKDHGSMLLKVHSRQTIPIEAEIEDKSKDDNKQIFLLLLGNSEIDDSLYINDCAKHELRRIMESIGNVPGVPVQHPKRIHIKCLADLPKKAFSNFMERYITRIEPIWITEEDPIEEESICISVCFNLSRLQDDIAAVHRITPQDCKNMLVVIKNCREGMSPGSMLKSNPSDKFMDFTNILYDDRECYDCHINSLAAEKVQAFIDNN
ncbi:uncharacterized protein LOC125675357 isoform X2 [Ostrea edulis]|uniref:uncharacterized protein LOC125675357 isoform X2 n=1 Tax=Ostrea edulis TaxID=37623 RepID=UPI0024AF659E|nr:uncharacterized protein LOC125675357 isoform X2 [Ostrea edulis]